MKGHAVHPKKIQEKAPKLLHGGNLKRGGRAAGGREDPDEAEDKAEQAAEKKNVGGPVGASARAHGGRAARKSGGTCEESPFSSARNGTPAPGRKVQRQADG